MYRNGNVRIGTGDKEEGFKQEKKGEIKKMKDKQKRRGAADVENEISQ